MTHDRSHTMDEDPKMLRVNGFEALIESYAYQDLQPGLSLRVLSLIARESSMRAIRANMSLGHQVDIEGVGLLSWPRPSDLEVQSFHRRLPSGLISSLWIPKTATAYGIEPNQPAYLIAPCDIAPTIPPGFIPLLDRLLPFPVLASWAEALWQFGLEADWITPLIGHRLHAWEVHPPRRTVQDFITTQLQSRALPVPASAEPEQSSTIHRRATDHENDRTSEGGILSDTGTDHPGHRPADSEPLQPLRPPL